MFPFHSPAPASLIEPLESRRLLSLTVHFGSSMSAAQALAAHQAHLAHLAHLAHVRHLRHVRHVASITALQAATEQGFLTMPPPLVPMLSNPVEGALDSVMPVLTPIGSAFNTMNPITSPTSTPNVSLTTNPFSFSTTSGFADLRMFNG
jgi:hypothetical protein